MAAGIMDESKGQEASGVALELTWEEALPFLLLKKHVVERPASRFRIVPDKGQATVTLSGQLHSLDLTVVVEIQSLCCPQPEQLQLRNCSLSIEVYHQLVSIGVKDFRGVNLYGRNNFHSHHMGDLFKSQYLNKNCFFKNQFSYVHSLLNSHDSRAIKIINAYDGSEAKDVYRHGCLRIKNFLLAGVAIDLFLRTCMENLINPGELRDDCHYQLSSVAVVTLARSIVVPQPGAVQALRQRYEEVADPLVRKIYQWLNETIDLHEPVSSATFYALQARVDRLLIEKYEALIECYTALHQQQCQCAEELYPILTASPGQRGLLSQRETDLNNLFTFSHHTSDETMPFFNLKRLVCWALKKYSIFLEEYKAQTPGFSVFGYAVGGSESDHALHEKLCCQLERSQTILKREAHSSYIYLGEGSITRDELQQILTEWREYYAALDFPFAVFRWSCIMDSEVIDFKRVLWLFAQTGYLNLDSYFPTSGAAAPVASAPLEVDAEKDGPLPSAPGKPLSEGLVASRASANSTNGANIADPPEEIGGIAAGTATMQDGSDLPPADASGTESVVNAHPLADMRVDANPLSEEERTALVLQLLEGLPVENQTAIFHILKGKLRGSENSESSRDAVLFGRAAAGAPAPAQLPAQSSVATIESQSPLGC